MKKEDLKVYKEKVSVIYYLTDKLTEHLDDEKVTTADMLKSVKKHIDFISERNNIKDILKSDNVLIEDYKCEMCGKLVSVDENIFSDICSNCLEQIN